MRDDEVMFGVDCDLHIVTDHAGATPSSRLSGSVTSAKTIGTVRLRRRKAATLKVPLAKMMSGASAINCAAFFCSRSASSSPQPTSIWTLRPSLQLPQTLFECLNSSLTLGIRCGPVHQHADAAYTIGLLRTRRERTCDR